MRVGPGGVCGVTDSDPDMETLDDRSDTTVEDEEGPSGGKGAERDDIQPSGIAQGLRDLAWAAGVVGGFLVILFIYSKVWPPLVVVESGSMMHDDDSSVGVIDTGDLVVVKEHSCSDIRSWVDGSKEGYRTYGDYGDVIIYQKNGVESTPIIHRPLVWVEFNITTSRYDVPSLDLYGEDEVVLEGLSSDDGGNITIDLQSLRIRQSNSDLLPASGFITMGDNNNPDYDQRGFHGGLVDIHGRPVQPVRCDWIVGVSRGEIPWYGVLKLVSSGNKNPIPPSSTINLVLSMAIILGVPMALDLRASMKENRRRRDERTARRLERAALEDELVKEKELSQGPPSDEDLGGNDLPPHDTIADDERPVDQGYPEGTTIEEDDESGLGPGR